MHNALDATTQVPNPFMDEGRKDSVMSTFQKIFLALAVLSPVFTSCASVTTTPVYEGGASSGFQMAPAPGGYEAAAAPTF